MKVDDEHLLDYLEGLYSRQDQIEQQLGGRRRTMQFIVLGENFPGDDPKARLPVGNFISFPCRNRSISRNGKRCMTLL
ncbi:MAG: hypothetical protein ACLUDU_19160 [Butyricimonas faecihominis]